MVRSLALGIVLAILTSSADAADTVGNEQWLRIPLKATATFTVRGVKPGKVFNSCIYSLDAFGNATPLAFSHRQEEYSDGALARATLLKPFDPWQLLPEEKRVGFKTILTKCIATTEFQEDRRTGQSAPDTIVYLTIDLELITPCRGNEALQKFIKCAIRKRAKATIAKSFEAQRDIVNGRPWTARETRQLNDEVQSLVNSRLPDDVQPESRGLGE